MTDGIVTVQAFLEIKVAKVVEQSSLLSHSPRLAPRLAPRPYPLPWGNEMRPDIAVQNF